ncbi:hypothetical protein CYLTODRAFT_454412 [Cylindrobasidium torrendii FP15055 ss-10]|uniref:Uncharacterized protein n=1 Tax=Cylindrobasidium torrendii FP15055 ss-10 TaxID=1314674 RepID=A0A0D7BD33_9AGAR|nr:hypothetical protein CYLTODRAFT_454412 [Cylindrobasidium torrendii FP15055 ss-10]
MSLPETPSNADNVLSRKDRSARQAPTIYATPISHFVDDKDLKETPTILDHPDYKTVGLKHLLPRLQLRLKAINGDLPAHDLLTGRKIYGSDGENSQLSHIAHQQIEYLDFFRLSEAVGVKYLNPHSTGNVLESLVDVHNLYNQLRDILLPPKEDLERFRDFVFKNLELIKEGKPPINIFEAEGFDKLRLWEYEFTCLLRETPLHVFFNEDGTLILDQISNPGRQIEMPAHGYMIRGIPTHIVFVFLGPGDDV